MIGTMMRAEIYVGDEDSEQFDLRFDSHDDPEADDVYFTIPAIGTAQERRVFVHLDDLEQALAIIKDQRARMLAEEVV
jgi:hypothetical protein